MSSDGMMGEVKVEKMEVEDSVIEEMLINKKGEDFVILFIKSEVFFLVVLIGLMSFRRRRFRRCRWYDNDLVCE